MTLPREVLPGRSYLITRRCTQRQFLMRPDKETNQAFLYCLAESASRHDIEVLFTIAMSNHHHTGIFDPNGNYPAFLEHFHKLFAKCQNALRGRWENFWATEQTSVVRLVSPEDVLEKLIYAVTNPVKDHLVEKSHQWPGVSSYLSIVQNTPLNVNRPTHFFRSDGDMPKEVSLRFSRPTGFDHLDHKAWAALVVQRVHEVELKVRLELKRKGLRPVGARTVLRQVWSGRPKSAAPRRDLNPRVASKSKWRRVEALLQNKAFLAAYRHAFDAFRVGMRNVLFPNGTYWLQRFANVLRQGDLSPPVAKSSA